MEVPSVKGTSPHIGCVLAVVLVFITACTIPVTPTPLAQSTNTVDDGLDIHEPNDTREQAARMLYLTVEGYISHSRDVDMFQTPATYGGYLLAFTVDLEDLPADYDLYVYDSANKEIARSTNQGVAPEHVYYHSGPRTGNSYWLKIVGVNGACDPDRPYRLRFTMNPDTPLPTPTPTP